MKSLLTWRCGQENPSKPIRGAPGEAGDCVKQEGARKANSIQECPEEAPCLVLGPSSSPHVVPTLLVPTLAARVAGAPQNREGSRVVTMSAGGRCCEFLHPCRSEGCLTARASVRCPAARAGLRPLPALPVGEQSHSSRKPPQGHAVTSPGPVGSHTSVMKDTAQQGGHLGTWNLLPHIHPAVIPPALHLLTSRSSNPGPGPRFPRHTVTCVHTLPNLKFQAVDTHSKLFTE